MYFAHAVVDAPARENHLRVIAQHLCLVRQVVRVDADAVAADQAGPKRQEVPLRARRLQHLERVDADAVEDQRQLVDQRDVEVALRVLDHLGRLGHLDARCLVHAGRDDTAVDLGHLLQRRRRVARHHLGDLGQRVLLVAGVDALGRVAHEEVFLPLHARVSSRAAGCTPLRWHPGYTVDSYTTMAPRFRFLPTAVLAPTSGEKSGMCASSTGVGTATTMKSASFNAAASVVGFKWAAAFEIRRADSRRSDRCGACRPRSCSTDRSSPMVGYFLPNSTASGSPTQPSPTTAIVEVILMSP